MQQETLHAYLLVLRRAALAYYESCQAENSEDQVIVDFTTALEGVYNHKDLKSLPSLTELKSAVTHFRQHALRSTKSKALDKAYERLDEELETRIKFYESKL